MITVLWAYEGWQFGTYSAGEVRDPQKSFPRAFLTGSLLLAGLYLFAVLAYLVALGPQAAIASDTIAAAAAKASLGPWAGILVAVAILISTFSSTNSVLLTAPRVFFAMANDNLFFAKLAEVHPRFGTPAFAILVLGLWSCVLALAGGFEKLANGAILIGWIFYGLAAAAIFRARSTNKGRQLPYRVPGYPVTPLLFVLAALVIVGNAIYNAIADPRQFNYLLVAIALLLLGLPGYLFWMRRARNHRTKA
jgi:basic amino acid/polyamine antiporter, APA family